MHKLKIIKKYMNEHSVFVNEVLRDVFHITKKLDQ